MASLCSSPRLQATHEAADRVVVERVEALGGCTPIASATAGSPRVRESTDGMLGGRGKENNMMVALGQGLSSINGKVHA